MPVTHVTVVRRVDGGWECVDDAGRRVVVPAADLAPELRTLRVGQRLAVREASGRRSVTLP